MMTTIEAALRERFHVVKDVNLCEAPCEHPLCETIHAPWNKREWVPSLGEYRFVCYKPRKPRVEWCIEDRTTGERGPTPLDDIFDRKKDAVEALELHIASEVLRWERKNGAQS